MHKNKRRNRTNGPPEGLQRSTTPWRQATSQLLDGTDGLQGRPLEGLHGLASSEPTALSPDPPLCLLIFCFISSGLQQPTCCLHTTSPRGKELAHSQLQLSGYVLVTFFCFIAAKEGMVEAKVAAYYIQWPSSRPLVEMRGSTQRRPACYSHRVHQAGSRLCAFGEGSVEASGWLLEARTSEAEMNRVNRRQACGGPWRPTLQPTSEPPSG